MNNNSPYSSDKVITTSFQGMLSDNIGTSAGNFGKSHVVRLLKAYPKSPVYLKKADRINNFTKDGVRDWYYNNVLSVDSVEENSDFKGSSSVNMNFSNTPDLLNEVPISQIDGDGNPATPYVPNFNSPEPGSLEPQTQATTFGMALERYKGNGHAPFVKINSDGSLNPKGTAQYQRQKFGSLFKPTVL